MSVLFIFLLSFNTPCWHNSHLIHKFLGILIILVFFKVALGISCSSCSKRMVGTGKQCWAIQSQTSVFITKSSFSGSTSSALSANNFESLFAVANNEEAVDDYNLRTKDLLTERFTHKEDSCQGITTVTHKEIQTRYEARIPQSTKGQLHGVHEY